MKTVLVLCTGNSCRSIMGEALINHLGAHNYRAYSAGSQPTGVVNPHAIETLKLYGIETAQLHSKSWHDFASRSFDLVITVCDGAAQESCPVFLGNHAKLHWPTPDPATVTDNKNDITAAFDEVYHMLKTRIESELL